MLPVLFLQSTSRTLPHFERLSQSTNQNPSMNSRRSSVQLCVAADAGDIVRFNQLPRPGAAEHGVRALMTFWTRAAVSSALVAFLVAFPVCSLDSAEAYWASIDSSCVDLQGKQVRCSESDIIDHGFGPFLSDLRFWQRVALLWGAFAVTCFSACALTQWRRGAP